MLPDATRDASIRLRSPQMPPNAFRWEQMLHDLVHDRVHRLDAYLLSQRHRIPQRSVTLQRGEAVSVSKPCCHTLDARSTGRCNASRRNVDTGSSSHT